jgi:hypothetical protein
MPKIPIVLFGKKDDWSRILDLKGIVRDRLASKEDLESVSFAETAEEAWAAISHTLLSLTR